MSFQKSAMQPTGIELGISFPPCRRRTRSCLAKPDKMISLFGKITGKMSSEKCLWGNNTYHPKWTVVHIPRPHTHILSNVDGPGFPQRWYSQSWNTLIWILFQKFSLIALMYLFFILSWSWCRIELLGINLIQTSAFSIANPNSMRFKAKVKENRRITLTLNVHWQIEA